MRVFEYRYAFFAQCSVKIYFSRYTYGVFMVGDGFATLITRIG